jgi:Holliday junction resolvase-like predicted endonuclease
MKTTSAEHAAAITRAGQYLQGTGLRVLDRDWHYGDGRLDVIAGRIIRAWRLRLRSGASLKDLAWEIGTVVRGWISCYGRFYPSVLATSLNRINGYLVR